MEKKLNLVLGGVQLLVALGVSVLVGGALTMVTPAKLGPIKKLGVGMAGLAISAMSVDGVTQYVEKEFLDAATRIKDVFKKKEEKTIESEEVESQV